MNYDNLTFVHLYYLNYVADNGKYGFDLIGFEPNVFISFIFEYLYPVTKKEAL